MISLATNNGFHMDLLPNMADLPDLNPGSAITPENIKRRRRELGMTQKELGEVTGVSDRAVRAWELGASNPEGRVRAKLAEVMALEYTPASRKGYVNPADWPEFEIVRRRVRDMSHELATLSDLLDRMTKRSADGEGRS